MSNEPRTNPDLDQPASETSRQVHTLVPIGFGIPNQPDAWLVIADWWDEHGEVRKSTVCRKIARSLESRLGRSM